jgi:hypothetical protein
MRAATPIVFAFLLLGVAGCSQDAEDITQQADKTLTSWSSTLQLADDELTQGSVTKIYAHQTAREALDAVDDQQEQLQQLPANQPMRGELLLRAYTVRLQAEMLSQRTGHPEPRS